jgi:hypothetical protein
VGAKAGDVKSVEQSDSALRPSEVRDLARKLNFLLTIARVTDLEFARELGTDPSAASRAIEHVAPDSKGRKKKNKDAITPRTVRRWLSDKRSTRQLYSQDRIAKFFARHIIDFDFSQKLFQCPYEEFARCVQHLVDVAATEVRVPLAHALEEFNDHAIEQLVGRYRIYRYSFANAEQIISEIGLIRKMPGTSNILAIDVYSPSSQLHRPIKTLDDSDHFKGILFQFGPMLYLTASLAKGGPARIRYYHFPRVIGRPVHYGIATGYSTNLDEPVATKVLAIKLNTDSIEVTDADASEIHRYGPGDEKLSAIRDLLENHISEKNHFILRADQSEAVSIIPHLSHL